MAMDYQKLEEWHWNEGASNHAISDLVRRLEIDLPGDYLAFLEKHDGGEGFVDDEYIIIWRAGDIIRFNHEYEVQVYAPDLLLFGSNGGGEAYAFDKRATPMPVVQVPFIGMDVADAIPVAESFSALFSRKSS